MSGAERPVGHDDLTALVDGRVAPGRRDAVDRFLAGSPETAGALRRDGELRAELRAALAGKAAEPVPARLRVAAIRAERVRTVRAWGGRALAAALCLTAGAGAGWYARGALAPQAGSAAGLVQEALAAHRTFAVEVVHPVEVRAAEERHLTQWLSKRLGRTLVVPDLSGSGLRLLGGRLLPAGRDVAAQLMYGNPDGGQRVTLYVRSGEAGEAGLQVMREGDLSAAYWVDAGYGYAVSAPVDRDRLVTIARAARTEIGAASGP